MKVQQGCFDLYPPGESTQKIGRFLSWCIMTSMCWLGRTSALSRPVVAIVAAASLWCGYAGSAAAWAQAAGETAPVKRTVAALPRGSQGKYLGSGREDENAGSTARAPTALGAGPGPSADADRGLLKAVLYAFEPAPTEIRVLAVEDLGLLGDPRGLNPLAQLVLDANPVVQAAAIRAIRNIAHPRAEAILSNVVRHPSIPDVVKTQALDALLFQNSPSAMAFLLQVSRGSGFSAPIQGAAQRVLVDAVPGRQTRP